MKEAARDWWNAWADQFQTTDISVAVAFGPGAPEGDDLGLLGDVSGLDAIELGCGGAQFGIAVAERGATVTGVDISSAQLDHARHNADEHGVEMEFVEASVTDLPVADDADYDLAFSAYAFQWIEDLDACFREAHRILRDGGRFVFSLDHPFYKLFDPDTREIERSYFSDDPHRWDSDEFGAEMVVHRHRVSDVVNALVDAGFTVDQLREPGSADPDHYVNDFGDFEPELMAKIPPTLVVAARK